MSTAEQEVSTVLAAGKVCAITISYNQGEPTVVGIFPDCCGEEYATRAKQLFAIAHGLADQAYKNLEMWSKESEKNVQEKSKHDPSVA